MTPRGNNQKNSEQMVGHPAKQIWLSLKLSQCNCKKQKTTGLRAGCSRLKET